MRNKKSYNLISLFYFRKKKWKRKHHAKRAKFPQIQAKANNFGFFCL